MDERTKNQVTELEAWRSFAFYLENCMCKDITSVDDLFSMTFEEFCESENYEILPVFSPQQVFNMFIATGLGMLFWCAAAFGIGFWWGYNQ